MEQKVSKTRQKINTLCEENEYASMKQNQTRARSLSVGTAGGGIIELNMRGDYGNLWYQMQPTEAIEIIGQIAAAAGVEIVMRPKQDFSSWRSWDTSLPPSVAWMGAAPWQLTDEQRLELEAAKAKNIKVIGAADEFE
jgi:hypothetical protein